MAQIDIGYFGDARLEKTAHGWRRALASGKQFASESSETTGPSRSSSGGFC